MRASSAQAGLLAQVLDRARQLARVALGEQLRGQRRVDDDDDALVVRDRGPRTRRGEDLDLVGAERDAAELDTAVDEVAHVVGAGGGHDRRDGVAVASADDRQQRLDAPRDELGLVADELDLSDVQLVSQQRQELRAAIPAGSEEVAGAHPAAAPARGARAAGGRGARLAAQRAAQLDRPTQVGHRGLERLVAQRREIGASASA